MIFNFYPGLPHVTNLYIKKLEKQFLAYHAFPNATEWVYFHPEAN